MKAKIKPPTGAYFIHGEIRVVINGIEHAIDGDLCDVLVNELLTARHLEILHARRKPRRKA